MIKTPLSLYREIHHFAREIMSRSVSYVLHEALWEMSKLYGNDTLTEALRKEMLRCRNRPPDRKDQEPKRRLYVTFTLSVSDTLRQMSKQYQKPQTQLIYEGLYITARRHKGKALAEEVAAVLSE